MVSSGLHWEKARPSGPSPHKPAISIVLYMVREMFLHGFLRFGKCFDMVSSRFHREKQGPVGPSHISQRSLMFLHGLGNVFTWIPEVWGMF